jgi:hypothetical protein
MIRSLHEHYLRLRTRLNSRFEDRFSLRIADDFGRTMDAVIRRNEGFVIGRGSYTYTYLNMCFVMDVLSRIALSMSKGLTPTVGIRSEVDANVNIWEQFFLQPFGTTLPKSHRFETQTHPLSAGRYVHDFFDPYDEFRRRFWSTLFNECVIPNPRTEAYVRSECDAVFGSGARVLGVLCRGTDYTATKPRFHPIQPSSEQVIEWVRKEMNPRSIDFIYVASEERRIVEMFERAFPSKVLTNKRMYHDDLYYAKESPSLIGDVYFGREDEDFLKGLEYLSSIYILSRCVGLVGGNCGGSAAALYLNNFRYEFWHLFNLGRYGFDDTK